MLSNEDGALNTTTSKKAGWRGLGGQSSEQFIQFAVIGRDGVNGLAVTQDDPAALRAGQHFIKGVPLADDPVGFGAGTDLRGRPVALRRASGVG